jgi:hypothetical protein
MKAEIHPRNVFADYMTLCGVSRTKTHLMTHTQIGNLSWIEGYHQDSYGTDRNQISAGQRRLIVRNMHNTSIIGDDRSWYDSGE